MFVVAMQHGMVWVGNPILPEQHQGVPYDEAANRLGSWSGLMAQAGHASPADAFAPGDVKTAHVVFVEESHDFFRDAQNATMNMENRFLLFFGLCDGFLGRAGRFRCLGEDQRGFGVTHIRTDGFQHVFRSALLEFVAGVRRLG